MITEHKNEYRGKGKILLFGEHSAVVGYPALGVPLDFYSQISKNEDGIINLDAEYEPFRQTLMSLFDFATAELGLKIPLREQGLSVFSSVPPESGLGSSAALCTALAAYLFDTYKIKTADFKSPWHLANRLESFFHGTPSGIDTGLSETTGPAAFYFKGSELPDRELLPPLRCSLLVGTVPRKRPAKELIAKIREMYRTDSGNTRQKVMRLGSIAEQGIRILKENSDNQATVLGLLANEAHELLCSLGLGDPLIGSILSRVKTAGCTGGKLSGAGAGGAFWIAVKNDSNASEIQGLLDREFNVQTYILSSGHP